jgi:hypothetical protein
MLVYHTTGCERKNAYILNASVDEIHVDGAYTFEHATATQEVLPNLSQFKCTIN